MHQFLVLKHFRWGNLQLEKGQRIFIEKYALVDDHKTSGTLQVSVENHPDQTLLVSSKAVEGMVLLENIALY